jgi:hypothetical protein
MYLETVIEDKNVSIRKENGIYGLLPDGGSGKTYLYHLLNVLNSDDIATVTYHTDEKQLAKEITSAIDPNKQYKLIYMDRADLYMTEDLYKTLLNISKHSTIIMVLNKRPEYTKNSLLSAVIVLGKKDIYLF